jgi:hypothetical protein
MAATSKGLKVAARSADGSEQGLEVVARFGGGGKV